MISSCIILKNRLDYNAKEMYKQLSNSVIELHTSIIVQKDIEELDFDNETVVENIVLGDIQYSLNIYSTKSKTIFGFKTNGCIHIQI